MAVGKRLPRIDGVEKVAGRPKYSVDMELTRMLCAKIHRSPYPHAKILNLDSSKAERLIGVKAVLIPRDIPKIIHETWDAESKVLALDKVRYIGDEVAAVAATDEDIAEEALDFIDVEYEELIPVFDPLEALQPGAPKIHEKSNMAAEVHIVRGDPEKGFKESDYIFDEEFKTPSMHQCYMEPTSCIALSDLSGKITLWTSFMDPFSLRLSLAKVLNTSESKVRIIQPYVGGAFGGKTKIQPIHPICALLAKKADRPVKIVNTREEEFISTRPRLPVNIKIKMGVKKDGTFTAKEVDIIADNGAYSEWGPLIMAVMANKNDSLYRFSEVKAQGKCIFTNKAPAGAFRGFGNLQMSFALESMIETIAKELNIEPLELRLKNAIKAGDISIHGWVINSCGLEECLKKSADALQWKEERLKSKILRGMGMACQILVSDYRITPGFGGSNALVKVLEDGKIQVITGEIEVGQGSQTVFAQIIAEELGILLEDVKIYQIDTDVTPYSLGPYGDRITISGGNAVRLAAIDARRQLFEIASEILEANIDDLNIGDRRIYIKGSPAKAVSISDVAKMALYRKGGSGIIGKGTDERDTVLIDFRDMYGNVASAYGFAAQGAEVKIDLETGQAKIIRLVTASDLGKAINPMAIEGQTEGGMVQGIGHGFIEEIIREDGRTLNPDFLNYKIPTALDIPELRTVIVESNELNGPYGAKGMAEAGIVPTPAAIANALYDALGIRFREIPIAPEKILEGGHPETVRQ